MATAAAASKRTLSTVPLAKTASGKSHLPTKAVGIAVHPPPVASPLKAASVAPAAVTVAAVAASINLPEDNKSAPTVDTAKEEAVESVPAASSTPDPIPIPAPASAPAPTAVAQKPSAGGQSFGVYRLVRLKKAVPCDACQGTVAQETHEGDKEVFQCDSVIQPGETCDASYVRIYY